MKFQFMIQSFQTQAFNSVARRFAEVPQRGQLSEPAGGDGNIINSEC